jgi:hypothetical protein
MDTYERGKWSSLYNPVIRKMEKENWFVNKKKVDGIERVIELEREDQRTNFYVETGSTLIKHGIYAQWSENKDKALHDGYWHVMSGPEIESFGMLERESAEREAAKRIYYSWGKNPNMELIRMVSFEEGQAFPQCSVQDNFDDYWKFVKGHLASNNIKMTGNEHQRYGVPLIENNGAVYALTLSYANWGKIMAEAFEPENKDEAAYNKWAGERPAGEESWVNPDIE